jgi:hypothetical protein
MKNIKQNDMKKIYITLVLLFTAFIMQAAVLHVDNNPNRPAGYYKDINTAITNANAGDSLYIYPSTNVYGDYNGDVTITKKLHFFGFGYNGTVSGALSRFRYINLDTTTSPSSNPSGSTFQGLTIYRIQPVKSNINDVKIIGNYFYSTISLVSNCSGWTFANNYFASYLNLYYGTNITVNNNIFYGHSRAIYASHSSTVIISHNLFMAWQYFDNVTNATVSNNIFICNGAPNTSYMNSNTFVNNLSWQSTASPYPLPPASNTGSGNISNQDPQFETATASGYFDPSKDYHLKSTSPGKNAASDGTDIGPYGGVNPFVWGGAFTIPKVTEMYIKNPVVNQGTNINVKLKGKKADL